MRVLIISKSDLNKFPIWYSDSGYYEPPNNTVNGEYYLQLEAEQYLIDNGISYTIGEVEIKQEEIE